MGAAAFNRARRQAAALGDAKARNDEAQNTPLNQKLDAKQMGEHARTTFDEMPKLASPPYPDEGRLVNIPSDANLDREFQAAEQAELNKTRVLSDEAREELQNSHLRDDKTKAIPDHDEAGHDRSQFAMQPVQESVYDDTYSDKRVPQRDGRIRATEPYHKRPDVDTTESKPSRQSAPTKLAEDDDPKTVGEISERGAAKAAKRMEAAARFMMVPTEIDAKEALQTGGISKMIETPPMEASEAPAPNHSAQDDMPELGKSAKAGIEADPTRTEAQKEDVLKTAEAREESQEEAKPEAPKRGRKAKDQEDKE